MEATEPSVSGDPGLRPLGLPVPRAAWQPLPRAEKTRRRSRCFEPRAEQPFVGMQRED